MTQYDGPSAADDDAATPPGLPRWVKIAAIVVGLLILIVVILQITGLAGEHGPGMHSSLGPTPPSVELAPAPR